MNILILEDNCLKYEAILQVVRDEVPNSDITLAKTLKDFNRYIEKNIYDLIITDLLVPRYHDEKEIDCTNEIIEGLSHSDALNLYTTTIALTQFDDLASENFTPLNAKDIIIVTYNPDSNDWKETLKNKINKSKPQQIYKFIIVCALDEEADAFKELDPKLGNISIISGLLYTEITIGNELGIIIRCSRMGLVSAAITATKAIELFKPKIVCMSGICAGIQGKTNIYDVIIPEMCHQHDAGKWTKSGFIPEPYNVQIDHDVNQKIKKLITNHDLKTTILSNIKYEQSELPSTTTLQCNILIGIGSSGSSVLANQQQTDSISQQHRKLSVFEMESYALYESARVAFCKPLYFSAKSVVDNGDDNKGDSYHRIGCLLSAKTVVEILKELLV